MDSNRLRREGMADAVVRIVLSRSAPLITADRWCEVLHLERADVMAALARLKAMPTKPLFETPTAPPEVASVRRREARSCRKDGNPLDRQPRNKMDACPFCGEGVMVGKRWFNHMCANHPDEWAIEMSRDLMERYADAECPDCGAPIHVKVTVEIERTCGCHSDPTWFCTQCSEDIPVSLAAEHMAADLRRKALHG